MGMNERIDRVLDDLVNSGAAPGVVAIVVNDHGPLYSGAAGTKGVGRSEPMTVDTMFCYASMTKAGEVARERLKDRRYARVNSHPAAESRRMLRELVLHLLQVAHDDPRTA
jgi:Beta-lactamase